MAGLNIKNAAVVSQEVRERATRSVDDILKEVDDITRRHGLFAYEKPEGAPPPLSTLDVAALTNNDIETFYAKYVGYAAYISTELARVEAAYKISTANLRLVEATIKTQLYATMPKAEVSSAVKEHATYQAQEYEHLKIYATKEILDAHLGAYTKQAAALSRIIEIRKLEQEQEQRHGGIRGAKRPNPIATGSFKRPRPPQ